MRRSPAPELSDSITRNRIESASVAGFPIPHTDSANTMVDLNAQLLVGPPSLFFPVSHERGFDGKGSAFMRGIRLSSTVRSIHSITISALGAADQEYLVRRLYKRGRTVRLMPENEQYPAA